MVRQTCYTVVTALPAGITRQTVLDFLHSHLMMIDLNPLVAERHQIPKGPARASAEEFSYATWYSLTDKIAYLPGGLYTGRVSYHVCFHDLPDGLQTHCYAPLGLDIKERWTVGGFEPGELKKNMELGIGAPKEGLYLREDVDMHVSSLVTGFVKKNLRKAHGVLVERLVEMAARRERDFYNERLMSVGGGGGGHANSARGDGRSSRSLGSDGEHRRTPTLVSDASVRSLVAPTTPRHMSEGQAFSPAKELPSHRNSAWTISTMQTSPTSPTSPTTIPTYPFSPSDVTSYTSGGGIENRFSDAAAPPPVPPFSDLRDLKHGYGHYRAISAMSGGPPLEDDKGAAFVTEYNGPSELQNRSLPAELPA